MFLHVREEALKVFLGYPQRKRNVAQGVGFWSEQSTCAAHGSCRQNVVTSFRGVIFSLLLHLLFSQKGSHAVVNDQKN